MPVVAFGVFELDEDAGELRRQGRLVHLTGQPFKALHLLVSRPGEIVTRDELRRHIWSDSRFVDFDRNLNFCIAAARDALGDSARSPRFIETIPRRGYRFIADVRRLDSGAWRLEVGGWSREGLQPFGSPIQGSDLPLDLDPECGKPSGNQPPASNLQPPLLAGAWRWLTIAALVPLLVIQAPASITAHTRSNADPAALAAFEQGWTEAAQGVDGQRRSVYRFREAIRIDPRFAEAHYALADVYLDLAGTHALPPDAALTEARDAALRAIALEDVADTRKVLGVVRLVRDWDWSGARRELERALAAEPNVDSTLTAYARLLSAAGEHDRAIDTIDRAETISPSCDLLLWESALIRYRAHRGVEALEKASLALEYGPPGGGGAESWERKIAWLSLLVHADRGEWADAAANARTINPGVHVGDRKADVLAFVGRAAGLHAAQTDAKQHAMWTATLYAVAGDTESALAWIERAARERDPELVFGLMNPAFDGLRGLPRFRAVTARVGRR